MSVSPHDLPDYERHLLLAMAYFLGRDADAQARACLCMYLRQSEPRIMAQVRYYAHRIGTETGQPMDPYELMNLIATDPNQVAAALPDVGRVHRPDQPDCFS